MHIWNYIIYYCFVNCGLYKSLYTIQHPPRTPRHSVASLSSETIYYFLRCCYKEKWQTLDIVDLQVFSTSLLTSARHIRRWLIIRLPTIKFVGWRHYHDYLIRSMSINAYTQPYGSIVVSNRNYALYYIRKIIYLVYDHLSNT